MSERAPEGLVSSDGTQVIAEEVLAPAQEPLAPTGCFPVPSVNSTPYFFAPQPSYAPQPPPLFVDPALMQHAAMLAVATQQNMQ